MSVGDIVKLKTNFTIENILNDRILLSNSNNINNEIVNIDGKISILDYPFNHQLTFIESNNDYILKIMDLPEDMIIEIALNYDSNNINQLCPLSYCLLSFRTANRRLLHHQPQQEL